MMKEPRANIIIHVLLWAAIATVQGGRAAAMQSPEPKTVADFFLLVPEIYIGFDLQFREELLRGRHRGAVVDIRNRYISWKAPFNSEQFEFTIFRKSDGKYLVAYSVGYDSQFPDASRLLLLSYEGGRWQDVTEAWLPVAYDRRLTYRLPRRSRSIKVTNEEGRKIYTLTWANDRFSVNRADGR